MCRGASLGVSGCGFHGLLRLAGVNAAIYRVFLQRAKANALRLNELLHAELLSMAALTPAQLVINQATARYPQTGNLHSGELAGGENPTNQIRIDCLISGIFCDVSRTSQIRLRLSGWI